MRALLLAISLVLPAQSFRVHAAFEEQSGAVQSEFFSGVIVSFTQSEVVVYRRTLTSDAVTKTFTIDKTTKMDGMLKAKARVTVRFVNEESVSHAIEIIVR